MAGFGDCETNPCTAMMVVRWVVVLGLSWALTWARATELTVAVAANFAKPMQLIAQQFEKDTGHKARLSFGATGQLYTQIKNGAPFAVLVAADHITPAKLAQEGLGLASSRFTYAQGKLVLWSAKPGLVDAQGMVLQRGGWRKLVLADPKLAPYGVAAMQVLDKLQLRQKMMPQLVMGANISQAHQFVATGNADLGFVALSQVSESGSVQTGSAWLVPQHLYSAIQQDAILLKPGWSSPAAQALMLYLKGSKAKAIMRRFGYSTEK